MPEINIKLPEGFFETSTLGIVSEESFWAETCVAVADIMSCRTDDDEWFGLDPTKHIDLFPATYGPNAHVTALGFVVITAFDYKDRMANIDERLASIKRRLQAMCHDVTGYPSEVSVRFEPCPERQWV